MKSKGASEQGGSWILEAHRELFTHSLAIRRDLAVKARKDPKKTGGFFLRHRDLVVGRYRTMPVGMHDLGYRRDVAMPTWDGPGPRGAGASGVGGRVRRHSLFSNVRSMAA